VFICDLFSGFRDFGLFTVQLTLTLVNDPVESSSMAQMKDDTMENATNSV